jgi:hypothetical protein
MELQHRIEMNALGADDLESVKFDLEMVNQEKLILEE